METSHLAAIRCPFCQLRPVESTAKTSSVRGFLIAYQISTRTLIGCAPCVRNELFKEAGLSALLGWFSITAFVINPFLIVYNMGRGIAVRPNPEAVMKRLKEVGYEPSAGADLLQVGYSLAAARVAADGKIDPEEVAVAVKFGGQLFEGFDSTRFQETCKAHADLPPSHELAWMLRDTLNVDQKQALFSYMLAIAQADGTISEEERAELGAVAAGLDLDLDAWSANPAEGNEDG